MNGSKEEAIRKKITRALSNFSMISPQDRILVAVSGGKDSTILYKMLKAIQNRSPIPFQVDAVLLDQRQPGFYPQTYLEWMDRQGLPVKLIHEDTYSLVTKKSAPGKSFCGLCSRFRRGILYNYAFKNQYEKIALGHHRRDLNETLFLNLFFNGRLASMPPKLLTDDKRNMVIRPLCYVEEDDLLAFSKELNIPVIPCNLCGSQKNLQRQKMKQLLADLCKSIPDIESSMITAQSNIRPSQLLDQSLWPFQDLDSDYELKRHSGKSQGKPMLDQNDPA